MNFIPAWMFRYRKALGGLLFSIGAACLAHMAWSSAGWNVAQDGVLLACFNPLVPLEENDYLEIVITSAAHDEIRRRLDLYGVFDKQLFPDLDGMAKWLKYHEFECPDCQPIEESGTDKSGTVAS